MQNSRYFFYLEKFSNFIMLTFNEYFGYRQNEYRFKRKQKRTQFSSEKLGISTERKTLHLYLHNVKQKSQTVSSSRFSSRRSLKSSPFKTIPRKKQMKQWKDEVNAKQKINNQNRHLYERFFSEDNKTRKEVVENKRDSTIYRFFQRKEQEKQTKKKYRDSTSKHNSSQDRANTINISFRQSMHGIVSSVKNLNIAVQSPEGEYRSDQQLRINSMQYEDDVFDTLGEEKDIIFPNQNNEYQMKMSKSILPLSKKECKDNNSASKDNLSDALNEYGESKLTEEKINLHYRQLRKLLDYVATVKAVQESKIDSFRRQIYLCRRLYFESLKNMKKSLSSQKFNCFILKGCEISDAELFSYKHQNSNNLPFKLRQIDSEVNAMQESLNEESASLLLRAANDPHLKIQNSNFESEIINQLLSEITELNQKILKCSGEEQKQHLAMRDEVSKVIVLVGQLYGLKQECELVVVEEIDNFFLYNRTIIFNIVEKLQGRPL